MELFVQLHDGASICVAVDETWRVEDLRDAVRAAASFSDNSDFELSVDGMCLTREGDDEALSTLTCGLHAGCHVEATPSKRARALAALAARDPPVPVTQGQLMASVAEGDHTAAAHLLHTGLLDPHPVLTRAVELNDAALLATVRGHLRECGRIQGSVRPTQVSLLVASARHADGRIAALLLEEDPGAAHAADPHGETPLLHTARHGNVAVCRMLLECEVDVNWKAPHGLTPLTAAAEAGHLECCTLLIGAGADVNVTSRLFPAVTPLFRAAQSGHADVCRLLVSHGADAHHVDEDGNSPMILASRSADTAFLQCCRVLADATYATRWRGLES